jgi:hypothetical protein
MYDHLIHDPEGAFYSVSVIIIVAIVIAIAVVIMTIYTDVFSGTDNNNLPLIGIKQEPGFVLIMSINNGPVSTVDCYAQILDKTTGQYSGNVTINDGNDGQLDIGDTILINDLLQGSYTVEIVIHDNVVGNCQYNVFTSQ